ncbi:hypothetical protein AAG570_009168 [Ranatra chinensis]|uniref:Uncharacterized protein n=1 Tax=Ranatra chinensis TaxID=642074 RepID=A0ABD0ZA17_9HEMI
MISKLVLVLVVAVGLSAGAVTPPGGVFPPGYLEKGADYVKDLVDKNRQLGNQVVSMVGGAAEAGVGLYKDAAILATSLGQSATDGAVGLGHKAVSAGTNIANQGLGTKLLLKSS